MLKKIIPSLALAGATVLLLAACTGTATTAGGVDCKATAVGASSAKVSATGKTGEAPTVKFPTPLTATVTERTVITNGSGTVAVDGSKVDVNYSAFNATTGKPIDSTKYGTGSTASFTIDEAKFLPGLVKALKCSSAGSRIAAIIPPVDAFGATGSQGFGIGATDSMVFVLDVVGVADPVKALPKANGADQPAEPGLPTVVLGSDGAPKITIPASPAPADLKIAVLKKGDGAVVGDGNTVTLHYTGVIWGTGAVFDSSWTRGQPASFPTTGVIPGFGKALVGQTVGSQVIAVIPPAEGYGDKGQPPSIGPTDTLVFVVDILATQ